MFSKFVFYFLCLIFINYLFFNQSYSQEEEPEKAFEHISDKGLDQNLEQNLDQVSDKKIKNDDTTLTLLEPINPSSPITTVLIQVEVETTAPSGIDLIESKRGSKILLGKQAFQKTLDEAFKKINFNSEIFWKNYEAKVQEDLKLKEPLWIEEFKKSGKNNLEFFLQQKRAIHFVNFGKLRDVLNKYKIKKLLHMGANPIHFKLYLDSEVNLEKLVQRAQQFAPLSLGKNGEDKVQYEKIFLSSTINLAPLTWAELGFQNNEEFIKALLDQWKNLAQLDLKGITSEVEIKNPRPYLQLMEIDGVDIKKELGNWENSLELKLTLNLTKVGQWPLLKMAKFKLDGEILLMNLKDNKRLLTKSIERPSFEVYFQSSDELKGKIMEQLMLISQDSWPQVVATLKTSEQEKHRLKLVINKIKSYQDLDAIISLINLKLGKFIKEVSSESFSLGHAVINVTYQGEKNDFSRELLDLAKNKLNSGLKIDFPNPHDPFTIELR